MSRVQRDSVAGRAYLDVQNLAGEVDDVLAMLPRAWRGSCRLTCPGGSQPWRWTKAWASPRRRDGRRRSGTRTQYARPWRVSLPCVLASARIRFHVDVNVGDPIWPVPGLVDLPRALG